jgi:ATP-dependent Clp protease ATP-binding subunit ClpA
MIGIVEMQVKILQQKLAKMQISLKVSDEAKQLLASEGFDPVFGARPLKRVIQRTLENQLAEYILKDSITAGASILATIKDGKIAILKPKITQQNNEQI